MTHEEFVEVANPHSWFLVADNLHSQAVSLRRRLGCGGTTIISQTGKQFYDDTNRATFLLASFALENAIKAFLVYEHPDWISEGKLSRNLRSHSLTKLALASEQIPYKIRSQSTLRAFEDGIESWARYPAH